MPELPEVETISRQLDKRLRGRTMKSVTLLQTGRETPRGKKFIASLAGKEIASIGRRAKLIVWRFTDHTAMLAHLKMTGRFVFVGKNYTPGKHDCAIFKFDHPSPLLVKEGNKKNLPLAKGEIEGVLVWSDVRKFGYLRYVTKRQAENILGAYGPEPLEISDAELAVRLKSPKTRKVKVALMDQATVAGVGNIYADEALFRAHVRPTRRLASLTSADRLRVAREIKNVLKQSIRRRGTSASDYVDSSGRQGGFLKHLRVYGRAGERCVVCGTAIKRIVIGQRAAHYCPKCQK